MDPITLEDVAHLLEKQIVLTPEDQSVRSACEVWGIDPDAFVSTVCSFAHPALESMGFVGAFPSVREAVHDIVVEAFSFGIVLGLEVSMRQPDAC